MSNDVWVKGLSVLANRYGGDSGVLLDDEHGRYALYSVALRNLPPDDDQELLALVHADPDRHMAEAVVLDRLHAVARAVPTEPELAGWLQRHQEFLRSDDFFNRRVAELLWLKRILGPPATSGDVVGVPDAEALDLAAMSDWMQRQLAEFAEPGPVLVALAGNGRTRKVRDRAQARAEK